jgi:putative addiction module antidote
MIKAKVTTVGNSTGIALPKEALARLNVRKGDTLFLVETEDGYRMAPYDPEFEARMAAAEQAIGRYRNALRELAK